MKKHGCESLFLLFVGFLKGKVGFSRPSFLEFWVFFTPVNLYYGQFLNYFTGEKNGFHWQNIQIFPELLPFWLGYLRYFFILIIFFSVYDLPKNSREKLFSLAICKDFSGFFKGVISFQGRKSRIFHGRDFAFHAKKKTEYIRLLSTSFRQPNLYLRTPNCIHRFWNPSFRTLQIFIGVISPGTRGTYDYSNIFVRKEWRKDDPKSCF